MHALFRCTINANLQSRLVGTYAVASLTSVPRHRSGTRAYRTVFVPLLYVAEISIMDYSVEALLTNGCYKSIYEETGQELRVASLCFP